MRGRDKFNKYKTLINIIVKLLSIIPTKILKKLFYIFRGTDGKIGALLRYIILKNISKNIGVNVYIGPNVYIYNPENLSIGNNVSIHPLCYLECYGGIEIGDDVSIAHDVTILSVNHGYKDNFVPIKDQELIMLPVKIENNIWIGAKSIILGGRTINSGSVIGAGTVLTKNFESNSVIVGNPGSVIKRR